MAELARYCHHEGRMLARMVKMAMVSQESRRQGFPPAGIADRPVPRFQRVVTRRLHVNGGAP